MIVAQGYLVCLWLRSDCTHWMSWLVVLTTCLVAHSCRRPPVCVGCWVSPHGVTDVTCDLRLFNGLLPNAACLSHAPPRCARADRYTTGALLHIMFPTMGLQRCNLIIIPIPFHTQPLPNPFHAVHLLSSPSSCLPWPKSWATTLPPPLQGRLPVCT